MLFRGIRYKRLVSIQFLAALDKVLAGQGETSKNALTDLYKNLSLQALSKKKQE